MDEFVDLKNNKPAEILELERMYAIEFIGFFENELNETPFNSYTFNKNGTIIGLDLFALNIEDISKIVNHFPSIEKLDISHNKIKDFNLLIKLKNLKQLSC